MHILIIYPYGFFIQIAPLIVYANNHQLDLHFTHVVSNLIPPETLPQHSNVKYIFAESDGLKTGDYPVMAAIEDSMRRSVGILNTLLDANLKPDLIYGDVNCGHMLFLKSLYDCPIISYGELYMNLFIGPYCHRREYEAEISLEFRALSLLIHSLALQQIVMGERLVVPTHFQKSTYPKEVWSKIEVIFEGVYTEQLTRRRLPERRVAGYLVPEGYQVITFASRSLEPVRGFDMFMQAAAQILKACPKVIFLIAGLEKLSFGVGGGLGSVVPDLPKEKSYKQWVLEQGNYDPERFIFLDFIPMDELINLFSISDLHIYLTIPYMLSWSLFSAMSCGCLVLGSRTEPVLELIEEGKTGLLADFYDPTEIATVAIEALQHPERYQPLREAAAQLIRAHYDYRDCAPKLLALFEEIIQAHPR